MLTFTIAAVLASPTNGRRQLSRRKPKHREHLTGLRGDVSGESWCCQSPTNFLDSLLSKNRHQHLPRRPHGQSDRMPSRESLILGQRQTSEALASSRLDHHMGKRERTRANGAPYPAQPSDQRDWDRLRHHELEVPPVIQGARPSFHPDQRLVFQSRSDRWAVVAIRNGSFVRRRKVQGHANIRQIRSQLFAGSNPARTSQSASAAWPPAATSLQRCDPERPRSAVRMARRCPDAPNALDALDVPDDRRTRKPCVTRRVPSFPEEDPSSFLLAISAGHLFAAHRNQPGPGQ